MSAPTPGITDAVFDAHLLCQYKAYLVLNSVPSQVCEYSALAADLDAVYRIEARKTLIKSIDAVRSEPNEQSTIHDLKCGHDLCFNVEIADDGFVSRIDAAKKTDGDSGLGSYHYEPVLFCRSVRPAKAQWLALAYRAVVLGKAQQRMPEYGMLIHGPDFAKSRLRLKSPIEATRRSLDTLQAHASGETTASLMLNRHCVACEFQARCREEALASDHLSQLQGMSQLEVARHNRNGIFTVNQLSYTFRARRLPKRSKSTTPPHSYALRALSLRERRVHVHGHSLIPSAKTQFYLDIEGVPDRDIFYLIGLLEVGEDGAERYHGYWANDGREQTAIFTDLIRSLATHDGFLVWHFGTYEKLAFARLGSMLPPCLHSDLARIRERSINLLSIIRPHVYFPTFSNSLKDIATFLGFKWTSEIANGLQSIVWRERWESTGDPSLKEQLIQYNLDDCKALMLVSQFVASLASRPSECPNVGDTFPKIVDVAALLNPVGRSHRFGKIEFAVPDLEYVNRCAYFDYQRDKVFIRTNKALRRINAKRQAIPRSSRIRPNKVIEIGTKKCLMCGSKRIVPKRPIRKRLIDIRFFRGGAKRWTTDFVSWKYKCDKCGEEFVPEGIPDANSKYGDGLATWCVYHNVAGGQSMLKIRRALLDVFGLTIPQPSIYRFKAAVAARLRPLAARIMQEILEGPVVHIDETELKLRKSKGYVWVFATMQGVYFSYRRSRQADFLQELLKDFQGVLVSDFFTGYDSLNCPQQKCIVHLLRDMNEDVLKWPFDIALKELLQRFASVLKEIIQSVDKYGLKKRHLVKFKRPANDFIEWTATLRGGSVAVQSYQRRIAKYGERLFTFLNYDGVPWNNNNAEHAIKSFAKYRRFADGRFTEASIDDYLTMLTVFQTCDYRNIDIVKFLLSKRIDLPE